MSDTAVDAAEALIEALWPEGTWAKNLTCNEANRVAAWIGATLGPEQERDFLQAHSAGDEDGDLHVEMGKVTRERGIGWSDD